jgi:putative SOS response-associated peptidase YedK
VKPSKPKYKITVFGRELFGIAAVWAEYRNPKTQAWERTFATFTSEPNGVMKEIHNRQPIILDPNDFEEWLSPGERLPIHLFRIVPDDATRAVLLDGGRAAKTKERPAMKGLFD